MPQPLTSIPGNSKASRLKDLLLDQILRGGASTGDRLWTEAELIRDYGVSVTTVRKALEDLARQGIVERKVGRGTFLRTVPRQESPASLTVMMLSFMSQALTSRDVYFGRIVAGIEETLAQAGRRFVMVSGHWGQYPQEEIQDIRRSNPAALILPFSGEEEKPFVAQLLALGIPLVLLNSPLPESPTIQVYFDDYAGGIAAAQHLLKRGYRRFAVLGAPADSIAGKLRTDALVHEILRTPGAELLARVDAGSYSQLDGYEAAGALAGRLRQKPDAVFCAADLLAVGLIQRLEQHGWRVPQDVAVMGYGDFVPPPLHPVQLTTMQMDLEGMGRRAAQAVLELPAERGPLVERHVRMAVELVEGQTA